MWIISTIECNVVDQNKQVIQNEELRNAEIIRFNTDPVTHMEIGEERRFPRHSAFDRGYEEFLRNYYNDNDIERRGKYRVHESEEIESDESSGSNSDEDGNDDDDDNDESESVESEERITRLRSPPKNKPNNGKPQIKNPEPNANRKKSKHCKNVKRDNMLCNVCYNPRNDEKSESCSFSSDPKEDNYSYSEDSSKGYSSKSPESLEEEDEDSSEYDERKSQKKKKYPNGYRHPQQSPRFYPPFLQRPFANYGPQTFLPPSYQPISRPGRRQPTRQSQIKNAPVAVVRYRTVETPFGSQRIRLISYPNRNQPAFPSQKYRKEKSKYRHQDFGQEIRPPRDINGAHSERLLSNVTKEQKEHLTDDLPSHSNDEADRKYLGKYKTFINKDWSKCKKLVDDKQICFECYVDGERRKECMFVNANKPSNFYESYSASKKSQTNQPYAFEYPTESEIKHSKNFDKIQPDSIKSSENKNEYSEHFNSEDNYNEHFETNSKTPDKEKTIIDSADKNNKQNPPQEQKIRSISDIIYGVAKPELIN